MSVPRYVGVYSKKGNISRAAGYVVKNAKLLGVGLEHVIAWV
jgi:hypothetical protein